MMNTMRKVMIVVMLLMTSSQRSENPNKGPDAAQPTTKPEASKKAHGVPAAFAACSAKSGDNRQQLSPYGPKFPRKQPTEGVRENPLALAVSSSIWTAVPNVSRNLKITCGL